MSKQTVQKRGRLGAIQVQQKHVNRDGTSNVSGWTPGLQDVHHVHGPDAAADVAAARGITVTSFVAPGEERAVESSKGAHGPSEKWVKGDGIEHDEVPAMSEPEMKETSAEPIAAPAAVAKPQPMGVAIKFILDGGDEVSVYANALVGSGSITSADSGLLAFVGRVICKEIVAKESREQRQNGSAHTIQLTTEDTPLKIIPASSFNTRDEWEGMFDAPKELDGNKYAMSLQRTSLQNTLLSIIKSAVSNLEPQEGVEVTTFTLDDRKKPTHVFYDRLAEEPEEGDTPREVRVAEPQEHPLDDDVFERRGTSEVEEDEEEEVVPQHQQGSIPQSAELAATALGSTSVHTAQLSAESQPTPIQLKFILNRFKITARIGAFIGCNKITSESVELLKQVANVIHDVATKLPSLLAGASNTKPEILIQQFETTPSLSIVFATKNSETYKTWQEVFDKPKAGYFFGKDSVKSLETMLLSIIGNAVDGCEYAKDTKDTLLALSGDVNFELVPIE